MLFDKRLTQYVMNQGARVCVEKRQCVGFVFDTHTLYMQPLLGTKYDNNYLLGDQ